MEAEPEDAAESVEDAAEIEGGDESEDEAAEPESGAEALAEAADGAVEEGPEPARIPTSLTATLREQGPRYLHRVSRAYAAQEARDGRSPEPGPAHGTQDERASRRR